MTTRTREILSNLGTSGLKFFVMRLRLPGSFTRRAQMIDALLDQITANLSGILERLDPIELTLLAEIAYAEDGCSASTFMAKHDRWCPSRLPDKRTEVPSPVWLFCDMVDGRLVMDEQTSARIKTLIDKPSEAVIGGIEEIPAEISDSRFGSRPINVHRGNKISLIELKQILALVKSERVRVGTFGRRPNGHGQQVIGEALIGGDFAVEIPPGFSSGYSHQDNAGVVRSHAWAVILQQCGWAVARMERLKLSDTGVRMLTGCHMAEFREGFLRLVQDDDFDELDRIPNLRRQSLYSRRRLTHPSERRKAIVASMKAWPMKKWIPIDEALRFTRASGNSFATCTDALSLNVAHLEPKGSDDASELLDRQYLRAFLFETLGTLGLLDLAYTFPHDLWTDFRIPCRKDYLWFCSRYDGLLYARLNPLGKYCLGLTDDYENSSASETAFFKILPNLEIVCLTHKTLPHPIAHMLDWLANPAGDFVWKIEDGKILDYLESGGSIEDLVNFMEGYSESGVPETVRYHVADLGRKANGLVGSEEAILFEAVDEATATLIAHDPAAARYCHRASERLLVIRKRNRRAFHSALRKMGYALPQ